MGRTAEALNHAEKKRAGDGKTPAARMPRSRGKWADWFGAARETSSDLVTEFATPTPPVEIVPGMSEEIVAYYERSSLKSEQYRSLRTRLLNANPRDEHRIFAISSAVPREGKSVTSANLGFSFGEIPHLKVLIVDGDLRQARMSRLLNVAKSPGLADYLQGHVAFQDIIQPTPLPNLFFVAAGKTRGKSATELLSRKTSEAAFLRFRKDFHYTIVDTPPATTVADVRVIGRMTNGVIFVIRMNRTPEPLARRAIKHILSNNVPIIGGLVIAEDDRTSGYGRQYSYYKYYKEDGT